MRRMAALGAIVAATVLWCTPLAQAAEPTAVCTLADPRLAELTGLAIDGQGNRWAIARRAATVRIYQLRADCSVRTELASAVDPNDLQDLALSRDGSWWLADIGDRPRSRSTIAMIVIGGPDKPAVYRLRYPDGPHDAKAILLGADGVPLVVTAELDGPAGVYRPNRPLKASEAAQTGVVPLSKVGAVTLPVSSTGNGQPGAEQRIVTGGAVTADGRMAALRTHTDAWLLPVSDGDLVAALSGRPVRIALPDQPSGEAIAFDQSGALVAGPAGPKGSDRQLVRVPGAARFSRAPVGAASGGPTPWVAVPGSGSPSRAERGAANPVRRWLLFASAVIVLVVAVVVVIVGWIAAQRRAAPWRCARAGRSTVQADRRLRYPGTTGIFERATTVHSWSLAQHRPHGQSTGRRPGGPPAD